MYVNKKVNHIKGDNTVRYSILRFSRLLILFILSTTFLYSQYSQIPWSSLNEGFTEVASNNLKVISVVGQNFVGSSMHENTQIVNGFLPGLGAWSGFPTVVGFNVSATWNLVSVPVLANDNRKITLFPTAISRAFYFNNGYIGTDTLQKGVGYWLNFPATQTINIQGTSIMLDAINVNASWNLIGMISYPVLASSVTAVSPVSIESNFFGFSPSTGYYKPDTLKPGGAYWVKVNQSGQLLIRAGSVLLAEKGMHSNIEKKASKISEVVKKEDMSDLQSVSIIDANNCSRMLYFSAVQSDVDLSGYELPPPPPTGIFDLRFESQRNVEIPKHADGSDVNMFPIKISGAKYPLTIKWNVDNAQEQYFTLEAMYLEDNKVKTQQYKSTAGEKIVIDNSELVSLKLLMIPMTTVERPKEFSLHQNYPNPFNPTTTLHFEIPKESHVSLKVYNTLGQEVAVLLNEVKKSGRYDVELNAHTLSSGVYFYRMVSDDLSSNSGEAFTSTKKLILLK